MARSQTEFRLACSVADYLHTCCPDLLWTAFPAGEARTAITGARLKRMGLARGWADYILILDGGQVAGLELKAPNGRQSPEQKLVAQAMVQRGARYFIITDLAELSAALASLGVQTRERAA